MGVIRSFHRIIVATAAFCGMLTVELKSQAPEHLSVEIPWVSDDNIQIKNAFYPDQLAGLPVIILNLDDPDIIDIKARVTKLMSLPKAFTIPQENFNLATLRKIGDRYQQYCRIDIVPFIFDSVENNFRKVISLEIELYKKPSTSEKSILRSAGEGASVLSAGTWIKIPVTECGIYKLDEAYLKKAGIATASINPKHIKIHGYGGGMLPQKNSDPRFDDLPEVAIHVAGESDGRFDKNDYILFYGQDPHRRKLMPNGELDYVYNYYSDTTFYFLNISDGAGLRMAGKQNMGDNHPIITTFDDFITHEKEEVNIINSGRDWFGEKFDLTLTYDYSFPFTDISVNTPVVVTSSVMGQTYTEASLDLLINGKNLGSQKINPISEGSYLSKGSMQKDIFTLNSSELPVAEKFTLRMSYNRSGSSLSKAYLNYFIIQAKRTLKPYGDQTTFRSMESLQHALSTYQIADVPTESELFDITDPMLPAIQSYKLQNGGATFGSLNSGVMEYILVQNKKYLIPEKAKKIHNQNLHGLGNADLLIISHISFTSEAHRLAEFRKHHDGYHVEVVTTDEIYNEFSSGRQDATAIRDFIRYIYLQGDDSNRLANVLLFGRGSFDYKNRIDGNHNYVPIYASRNSLHPINSYSSDDYYTFMDDEEGEWVESYSGDHHMDVGIGRLPVKSAEEARAVVDKLIKYSSDSETIGNWRNELVFIADDGDGNLHQKDADKLAVLVDTTYRQFNVNKIYVDAFPQDKSTTGESAPLVNEAISRSIEDGSLIVNFTGHGSVTRWTSETILNLTAISEYENETRFPLFVTATCEFGRHDNPMVISGAEYLLLKENSGAIGLVTTARPVFSSTNFILNRAFYNYALKKEAGSYMTMGEIFRRTKNESLNGSVNRNFSLLGDPSMTLSYAHDEIKLLAGENYLSSGDTLKALGSVKLKGQVIGQGGQINSAFSGTAVAKVFDQPSIITTLGNEDPPMNFLQRDNLIFAGEATVANGEFEVEFIVPKDISYDFNKGKISFYAYDFLGMADAAGSDIGFVVGGEADDYVPDNTPPEVRLYINDTTFRAGGISGPDIIFLAHLTDDSGIGISNSFEGKDLQLSIDDGEYINVSRYFTASKDTYRQGWVTYPMKGLSMGTHTARLGVRDVHNNYTEAEIGFQVMDDGQLNIDHLMNYPNPFNTETRIVFEHNRSGDDLEIGIDLYSSAGLLMKRYKYLEENCTTYKEYILNSGELRSGVYIMNLSVKSLSDGSKNIAKHKLVIIK